VSGCEQLTANATAGAAPALRAVDCLSNEATASAFGRLFGGSGALLPALTVLLTLYIAFFAISLLTGRSRIGIAALTPRMMTLGLVLTFATSWVAYQGVVWNLAVGAPDQIAGVLTGTRGSATQAFADKIDILFAAVAEAAENGGGQAGAAAQTASGSFSPNNLVWLSAVMLMLGTVGVLVTARIALAVLLAIGPVFVVLALFSGTRGLFAGWLRGVVLTSAAPLFAVIGGGFILELAIPVVVQLRGAEGIDGRAAMALFLVASVHVALMIMVLRVVATIVNEWTVFGLANSAHEQSSATMTQTAPRSPAADIPLTSVENGTASSSRRKLGVASSIVAIEQAAVPSVAQPPAHDSRTVVTQSTGGAASPLPQPRHRPRGIGSRFRPTTAMPREIIR